MNKLNSKILVLGLALMSVVSCSKKGCTDATAANFDVEAEKDDESCDYSYTVPNTYEFTDADGNSTVSYSGQTQRMDMLGELVSYMKTANNNPATTLDAAKMKAMYANSAGAGFTGTYDDSKQLKSKTALGDAAVQSMFEGWMDAAAAATPDSNDQYLQSPTGLEWTQMVEKGLMGACFVSQLSANYLANIESDDNVEIEEGKTYTAMEHHWDEAYGYFTDAVDFPANGNDRFWGKYATKDYLENNLGTATDIATAFRTGRAAISSGNTADALAQRDIILQEVKDMAAGMAVHYLNDVISKRNDAPGTHTEAKINHSMSEALAFIFGIQFATADPIMTSERVMEIVGQIENAVNGITFSSASLESIRDEIATAAGFSDAIKMAL